MFSVSTGLLGKLAVALMQGDDNVLTKIIEDKLEDIGKNLLTDLLSSSPVGAAFAAANRFGAAVDTGGASELDRLRQQWLNSVRPAPPPGARFLRKLQNSLYAQAKPRKFAQWQRGGWAKSRQQWLTEGWRHNWQSQPRDTLGRWVPGRLDYPLTAKPRQSRRQRRRMRMKRANRAFGRKAVRGIVSSWANDDGD